MVRATVDRISDDQEPDEPAILTIQPTPKTLRVIYSSDGGDTFIGRGWNPGDATRCRLCPAGMCNAGDDNWCLVKAPGHIPPKSCALYVLAPGASPGERLAGLRIK